MRAMAWATAGCFLGAAALSGLLVARGGAPVVWLAAVSILCGVFYTAGRYSLAYTGLADGFVLVFFGPVAVGGTFYLQFPDIGWPPAHVVVAGLGPGLIATALLTVNNLRDVDEDRESRKRTLAVRFGRGFARMEYAVCVVGALLSAPVAAAVAGRGWGVAAELGLLPLAWMLIRRVRSGRTGAELNPVLGATGKLLLLFALIFMVAWPLGA